MMSDNPKKKNPDSKNELQELQKKNDELHTKNQELLSTVKYVQAEFENYKKRIERDKEEQIHMANKDLIVNILPVIDNFEIALKPTRNKDEVLEGATHKDDDFLKGMELVYSQLIDILKKQGIEQIRSLGEIYNPHFHEVLMQVDSEEKSGKIIEEFQKGYLMKDRVLRPSKVKVAK